MYYVLALRMKEVSQVNLHKYNQTVANEQGALLCLPALLVLNDNDLTQVKMRIAD